MNYEKKYKEALANARQEYNTTENVERKQWLEELFPELAESKDERIRKELIKFVKVNIPDEERYIAWLEKQGKEEYALKSFKHEDVYKFMQYIEKEAKAYEFNLPNRGYDIYAFAKDILVWLEKQGESIKIKKGKNYLCTKTHKYAGVEWIKGVKYHSPEDYSLVNQGCTCYCPKYSKEEHNNFLKK